MGFEPTTYSMGSCHSTTELCPQWLEIVSELRGPRQATRDPDKSGVEAWQRAWQQSGPMSLVLRLLVVMAVIAVAPQFTRDIRVAGLASALVAAVVYGVLAVLIGWLVRFVVTLLSIVPGILTFGLFFLLIPILANAVLLKWTAGLLASFEIRSWSAAFLLSVALSVVNLLIESRERRAR